MLKLTLRGALGVATLVLATATEASAQRAIEPGSSPWSVRGAEAVELGELRLPDVRTLAPVDLADYLGTPLLLIEFASW